MWGGYLTVPEAERDVGVPILFHSLCSLSWLPMEFNLEAARISVLPDDAFYIPDFITEEEEARLLQKVRSIQPSRSNI